MPKKPIQQFTAWSFSRVEMWEGCPAKAKYKHLDKMLETPSKAMEKGKADHLLAEKFSLGKIKKLPKELELFDEEFFALVKLKKHLQTEAQLGLDKNWEPCDWFDPNCWVRIVADCMYLDPKSGSLVVIDYKTGKIKEEHKEQLSLYAIGAFAEHSPRVKQCRTELWYLSKGEIVEHTFSATDVPQLKAMWEKRAAKMLKDTSFKPTPGDSCRWCPYSNAKEGPCQF